MEEKKIDNQENETKNDQKDIKTIAIDTGKRIDVSGIRPKTITRKKLLHQRDELLLKKEEKTDDPAKEIEKEKDTVLASNKIDIKKAEPERLIPLYVEPVEFDESGDFASLLQESEEHTEKVTINIGDKVTGKVIHIGKEYVFISIAPKIEAAISASELSDARGNTKVHLGQKITSYVVSTQNGITLSNNVAQSGLDLPMLEEAWHKKVPVEGKIVGINKGGFDVQVSGHRAFCPIGQIHIKFVDDASKFMGQTLSFLIEKIEEGGRNIVLSRRSLLERHRREKAREIIKDLEVKKTYDAEITRVADFGAFADIGGLEGLIPRSEISYGHFDRVSDLVSSKDKVEVVVLGFDINDNEPEKSKLSLSLKKTKKDPYIQYWHKIKSGETLEGKVVRLESFGAFVELFPGIDGLIHISELSENRVAHPKEILNIGDPVTVRIVTVDEQEKRIALSLRETVNKKKASDTSLNETKIERGQKSGGTVSRIERYGVFLELECGVTALLPLSETGLPKNADLNKAFNIGSRLDVLIIDVDAQNRVRVSILARKKMEERDSYLQFKTQENEQGSSFGTLAELLKKKNK
jgi:small subunit ribosomal protein S1